MKRDKVILLIVILILLANLVYTNTKYQYVLKNEHQEIDDIGEIEGNSNAKICKHKNALNKLNIQSAYGDNEAYHPKVLYFENSWNGYKYWMAYSPYPHADDSKENPHIAVSNDLTTWEVPEGLQNPLDEISDIYKPKKIYNSDPHLIYNSDTDQLECWWRFVNDIIDQVIIYRMTSTDGVNWTKKEIIMKEKRSVGDYLSPAIIYEEGEYHVWYVSNGYRLYYIKSSDLKTWTTASEINLNYNNNKLLTWHIDVIHNNNKLLTWHIDVIHNNGFYEIILNSFINGEKRDKMNLYYARSENNIDWTNPILILTPSFASANWDNKGLYRSSLLHVNNEYYLFYSGISWNEERGVGIISGPSITELCYKEN